ncbi:hypothetical protein ACIBI9_66240 [Nonomuraea sp. NPDC050451]|uniref:hypothetical protein n=1 Tax=Nonomuraea sp. NPDC050451 TaxID=3364364 RepID=UPI0037928340
MPHDNRDLGREVRDRIKRTGEKYQEALTAIRDGRRFIFADDVERFLAGEGRRGIPHEEAEDKEFLLAGMHNRVSECHTCGNPGDAGAEDITVQLVVASYDPDLSPATKLLELRRNHARCAPSKLLWVNQRDLSYAPAHTAMCLRDQSLLEGTFAIAPRPVMLPPDLGLDPHGAPEPALLIAIEVTEDRGRGAARWLSELERVFWLPAGFGERFTEAAVKPGWSLRLVRGHQNSLAPNWIAIRVAEPFKEDEPPGHLYLGPLDISAAWAEALPAAGTRGSILTLIGPRALNTEVPPIPTELERGQLEELLEDGMFLGGYLPFIHDEVSTGQGAPLLDASGHVHGPDGPKRG